MRVQLNQRIQVDARPIVGLDTVQVALHEFDARHLARFERSTQLADALLDDGVILAHVCPYFATVGCALGCCWVMQ